MTRKNPLFHVARYFWRKTPHGFKKFVIEYVYNGRRTVDKIALKFSSKTIENKEVDSLNDLIAVYQLPKAKLGKQTWPKYQKTTPLKWRGQTKYILNWQGSKSANDILEASLIRAEYEQLDVLLVVDGDDQILGLMLSSERLTEYEAVLEKIAKGSLQPKQLFATFKSSTLRRLRVGAIYATEEAYLANIDPPEVPKPLYRHYRPANVINKNVNLSKNLPKQDKQLNLLVTVPFFSIGGAPNLILNVIRHLSSQRINVSVLSHTRPTEEQGSSLGDFQSVASKVMTYRRVAKNEANLGDLLDYLITSKNIKVLMNSGYRQVYSSLSQLRFDHPDLRVIDQQYNLVGHLDANINFASSIDVTNTDNDQVFEHLKSLGRKPANLSLISNGIDLKTAKQRPGLKLPKKYDKDYQLVCGFIGRLSEEKGPDVLVDAVKEVTKNNQDMLFIIAGDGKMKLELEEKIAKLGLEASIYLPGFTDTKDLLEICDLTVVPSRQDGLPLSALESLAAGVPVIATNVGGLPNLIKDQDCGFIVETENSAAIAEQVMAYASDKQLLKNHSTNARKRVEQHYSMEKMQDEYLGLINKLKPTTSQPLVTVLTAVYNGGNYLATTIDSILSQTYQNFEYILVNDCSSDNTEEIIRDFMKQDSRIKLVNNKENLGAFGSANAGLKKAKGKYIARIDHDDLTEPNRLAIQVNALEQNEEIGLVGSRAIKIDSQGQKISDMNYPTLGRQQIRTTLFFANPMIHSSIMFRTKMAQKFGGYNNKQRASQDYDFYFRVLSSGYGLLNLSQQLVHYREHDQNITSTQTKKQRDLIYTVLTTWHKTLLNVDLTKADIDALVFRKGLITFNTSRIERKMSEIIAAYSSKFGSNQFETDLLEQRADQLTQSPIKQVLRRLLSFVRNR